MREGLQGSDSDDQTDRPAVRGSSKKNLKRKKSQGEKQREKGKVKEAAVKTKKLKSKPKEESKATEKRERFVRVILSLASYISDTFLHAIMNIVCHTFCHFKHLTADYWLGLP